jgi:hypothetical protein
MNQTDPNHSPMPARSGWQAVGEITLPNSLGGNGKFDSLLQEKLEPLNLEAEFIHRVVNSIEQTLDRAVIREGRFEHIHLFIFVPANYNTQPGTWGFFRIERIDGERDGTSRGHAVDLYLYPEGR